MTKIAKKMQSGKNLFTPQLMEEFVKNGWDLKMDRKNRLRIVTR